LLPAFVHKPIGAVNHVLVGFLVSYVQAQVPVGDTHGVETRRYVHENNICVGLIVYLVFEVQITDPRRIQIVDYVYFAVVLVRHGQIDAERVAGFDDLDIVLAFGDVYAYFEGQAVEYDDGRMQHDSIVGVKSGQQ
jgi:hypothetical protein